ncbi:MAG: hypothetical protein GKR94_25565 [Gammaproteobacteria bacterium]|nr:hypothetical protein [Gammaproteobacteria bacterium]
MTLPDGAVINDVKALWGVSDIAFYDPAFEPYCAVPSGRFDGVICTDVLEHCPEQDVHWIIDDLFRYAASFLFCTISCQLASKKLPTGENAHITVKPPHWWGETFNSVASEHPKVRYFALCYAQGREPVLLHG